MRCARQGPATGRLRPGGPCRDLLEEAFLAAAGRFAQLAHQQFQEPGRRQVGQVEIDGLPPRPVQFMQEPLQEGGFAHPAASRDQAHGALFGQVAEAGQPLLHALVLPEGRSRDPLGEGLRAELEVREEHQVLLCFSWASCCKRKTISGMVRCVAR